MSGCAASARHVTLAQCEPSSPYQKDKAKTIAAVKRDREKGSPLPSIYLTDVKKG